MLSLCGINRKSINVKAPAVAGAFLFLQSLPHPKSHKTPGIIAVNAACGAHRRPSRQHKTARHTKTSFNIFLPTSILTSSKHLRNTSLPITIADASETAEADFTRLIGQAKQHPGGGPLSDFQS